MLGALQAFRACYLLPSHITDKFPLPASTIASIHRIRMEEEEAAESSQRYKGACFVETVVRYSATVRYNATLDAEDPLRFDSFHNQDSSEIIRKYAFEFAERVQGNSIRRL